MSNRFVCLAPSNPTAVFDSEQTTVYHTDSYTEALSLEALLNGLNEEVFDLKDKYENEDY